MSLQPNHGSSSLKFGIWVSQRGSMFNCLDAPRGSLTVKGWREWMGHREFQKKNSLPWFGEFNISDVPFVARSVQSGRWSMNSQRVMSICRTHMGFRKVRKTQSGSRIEQIMLKTCRNQNAYFWLDIGRIWRQQTEIGAGFWQ